MQRIVSKISKLFLFSLLIVFSLNVFAQTRNNKLNNDKLAHNQNVEHWLLDGKKLYVANRASNTVSVIDLTTNRTIKSIAVGIKPQAVKVSLDGKFVYIGNASSFDISVIDSNSDVIVKTIKL